MENVKSFLVSRALLKGDASIASRPLRHLRTESVSFINFFFPIIFHGFFSLNFIVRLVVGKFGA